MFAHHQAEHGVAEELHALQGCQAGVGAGGVRQRGAQQFRLTEAVANGFLTGFEDVGFFGGGQLLRHGWSTPCDSTEGLVSRQWEFAAEARRAVAHGFVAVCHGCASRASGPGRRFGGSTLCAGGACEMGEHNLLSKVPAYRGLVNAARARTGALPCPFPPTALLATLLPRSADLAAYHGRRGAIGPSLGGSPTFFPLNER